MTATPAAPTPGIAPCSRGIGAGERADYVCAFPWPEDCRIQGGEHGVVFTHAPADPIADVLSAVVDAAAPDAAPQRPDRYTTAFFEAFPSQPDTFIRGEGATVEAAEADCWARYQRIMACDAHVFERRGRRDGYGYCMKCGLGSMVFEPLDRCAVCGTLTFYAHDLDGLAYCDAHFEQMPEDKQPQSVKLSLQFRVSDAALTAYGERLRDALDAQDNGAFHQVTIRRGQVMLAVWVNRFHAGTPLPVRLHGGQDPEGVEYDAIDAAQDSGRLVDFIERDRWTPERAGHDAERFARLIAAGGLPLPLQVARTLRALLVESRLDALDTRAAAWLLRRSRDGKPGARLLTPTELMAAWRIVRRVDRFLLPAGQVLEYYLREHTPATGVAFLESRERGNPVLAVALHPESAAWGRLCDAYKNRHAVLAIGPEGIPDAELAEIVLGPDISCAVWIGDCDHTDLIAKLVPELVFETRLARGISRRRAALKAEAA